MEYISKHPVLSAIVVGILVLAGVLIATSTVAQAAPMSFMPNVFGNSQIFGSTNGASEADASSGRGIAASVGQQLDLGGSGGSMARQVNCMVFGILGTAGIMPGAADNCDGGSPPPPPPPPHQEGHLTVFKIVQGGSAVPANFTMHVNATSSSDSFPGSSSGTVVDIETGESYLVTEHMNSITGYTSSFSSGCSGVMGTGYRTCVVTNTFTGTTTPPAASSTVRLIKLVSGGTATSSNFSIHLHKVIGQSMVDVPGSPQAGSSTGTTYANLAAGTYHVDDTGGPSGYTPSFSGACNSSGVINLAASTSVTCTITNVYATSTATSTTPGTGSMGIFKLVTGGGGYSPSDFQIHLKNVASTTEVDGSPHAGTASGRTYWNLWPGTYQIWETGNATSSYQLSFSGACNQSGVFTVSASSSGTCTLTNTFNASSSTSTPTTDELIDLLRQLLDQLRGR